MIEISQLGSRKAVVSPSGDMILGEMPRHVPFYAGGRLILLNVAHPVVRHLVDDGLCYRFDWTAGAEGMLNQQVNRAP